MPSTNPPSNYALASADDLAEAPDRRREGRHAFSSPSLIALLRDPAAGPADDAPHGAELPPFGDLRHALYLEDGYSAQPKYPGIYLLLAACAFWSLVALAAQR